MRTPLFFSAILFSIAAYAQTPVIQKIEPETTFPNDTIVITGNGFSEVETDLVVWFETVKGEIVESSNYAIEVIVPAEAKLGPVQVTNLQSGLSGQSTQKFTPAFGGTSFSVSNFAAPLSVTATQELWDICACDLNLDGKPDIASTKFKRSNSFDALPTDIMLLQNNTANGASGAANALAFAKIDKLNLQALNLTFPTDNVVCGDLNGDGKPELVLTRAGTTRNSIHIFKNTSSGTISFAPALTEQMPGGTIATRMAIRDLNNDGKPEIVVTSQTNDAKFYIFLNKSTASTIDFEILSALSIAGSPGETLTSYDTDVQDFNGDGLPDILINEFQTSDIHLLLNESTGSIKFAAPQKIAIQGSMNRIVSADFNKDGKLDLALTSTLNDIAHVLINETTGNTFAFSAPINLTTAHEPWGIDASDIDGDGDADIAVTHRSELKINVFINNGAATPTFTKHEITTQHPTRNIKVTDLDSDGKPDILYTAFNETANPFNTQVTILRNTGCHQPAIQGPASLTLCNGQTKRLRAIPANNVTYTWKKNGNVVGGNEPFLDIVAPLNTNDTDTYTVTATGEGGACALTSQNISVTQDTDLAPDDPSIIGGDLPICSGETLSLSTPPVAGATYTWTGPNSFSSSQQNPSGIVASFETAGVYTLEIEQNGCKSNAVSKRIDILDIEEFAISANSSSNLLCEGTAISLSVNDLPDFTFQWKKDGTQIAATNASISPAEAGAYTVVVTPPATLSCPVTETEPFHLAFLTPPVAAFEVNETACVGQSVTFTNGSQVDIQATPVYTWTFGDAENSSDTSPAHTYISASIFTATLGVRYEGVTGCQANASHDIQIFEPIVPVIAASAESSCPDEEITLSISGSFSSVTWSNSATTNSIDVAPGTYEVTTIDVNGCPGEEDVTISSKEVPNLIATADPPAIAAGATTQLTASGAASYTWTPGKTLTNPGTASIDSLIANPIAKPLQTTTYTLVGTSSDGCQAEVQLTVTVEGVLGFPLAFSPNGDGDNEIWDIQAGSNPDCTLTIFDGRGAIVFQRSGENWDGTYNGKQAPEGTYYYVFSCPDETPKTGNLLLFR